MSDEPLTVYRIQAEDDATRTTIGPVFDADTAERYSRQGYRVTAQTTSVR